MNESQEQFVVSIRSAVLKHLTDAADAGRSVVPLVRIEEHCYEWGVSWIVSALASSASDEATISVVARLRAQDTAIDADVSCAGSLIVSMPQLRFSTEDSGSVASASRALLAFLQGCLGPFVQCCEQIKSGDAL